MASWDLQLVVQCSEYSFASLPLAALFLSDVLVAMSLLSNPLLSQPDATLNFTVVLVKLLHVFT